MEAGAQLEGQTTAAMEREMLIDVQEDKHELIKTPLVSLPRIIRILISPFLFSIVFIYLIICHFEDDEF